MGNRPYIICHMMTSIDGRIDGSISSVAPRGDYEATGDMLDGDAWICGRTTMQEHFAEDQPFVSKSNRPAGPQPAHVARKAESYAVSVDTRGKLRWAGGDLHGDHLICIVSELATDDYLAYLKERQISYIVSGKTEVDLADAVTILGDQFGIRRLLLEGGGHINGAFLDAGLVDEISLLLAPCIDGRGDIAALFDGMKSVGHGIVPLTLTSVEKRERGLLWIRYQVIRIDEAKIKTDS